MIGSYSRRKKRRSRSSSFKSGKGLITMTLRSTMSTSTSGMPRPSISSGDSERASSAVRSEEHTSELQSRFDLVCRLLLEKKKTNQTQVMTMVQVTTLIAYADVDTTTT